MDYKPLQTAINYVNERYNSLANRLWSMIVPGGLEQALAGVPNSLLRPPQDKTPDKLWGYLLVYSVSSYRRIGVNTGRVVVDDGDQRKNISIELPKNSQQITPEYIKKILANNDVPVNNGTAKKIAKKFREHR